MHRWPPQMLRTPLNERFCPESCLWRNRKYTLRQGRRGSQQAMQSSRLGWGVEDGGDWTTAAGAPQRSKLSFACLLSCHVLSSRHFTGYTPRVCHQVSKLLLKESSRLPESLHLLAALSESLCLPLGSCPAQVPSQLPSSLCGHQCR